MGVKATLRKSARRVELVLRKAEKRAGSAGAEGCVSVRGV